MKTFLKALDYNEFREEFNLLLNNKRLMVQGNGRTINVRPTSLDEICLDEEKVVKANILQKEETGNYEVTEKTCLIYYKADPAFNTILRYIEE